MKFDLPSPATVAKYLKRQAPPVPEAKKPGGRFPKTRSVYLTDVQEDQIVALRDRGLSWRAVEEASGISRETCRSVFKRCMTPGHQRRGLTLAERGRIEILRRQGMSLRAIAAETGRSVDAVKKYVKLSGVRKDRAK